MGRRPEVWGNSRFRRGQVAERVHGTFPTKGCVLAISKTFFMYEWTGDLGPLRLEVVELALARSMAPACDALASV